MASVAEHTPAQMAAATGDLEADTPPRADVEAPNEKSIDPRKDITKTTWILTCIGLYTGAFLYGLDTTIAADVQASVYQTLGHIEDLPWVGLGFPMGSVAVILLIGKFYEVFNVKPLILTSITLFELGSAICGAAPSSKALIVGRVIAGIGGSGMYIGALTYNSVFTSLRERPLYNALIGLAWGTGAVIGPVIGGGFSTSSATWRWAFYINLPLAGILSPVYILTFPQHQPQPDKTFLDKLRHIDWVGAVLNAGTFVLFMVVVTFSGSIWPWGSATSTALWVVFGVTLLAYVLQQAFAILTTPTRRLFPVHFLKSRTMVLLYITTAAAASAGGIAIYYVPLYFQFTKDDSAIKAGVRLLPFITLNITSIMVAGALLPVIGRYAPFYFPAGGLTIIGASLMYVLTPTTSTARVYGAEILIAIGSGLLFQNAYTVAAAKVSKNAPHDLAKAIGFINVAQIGSIAIGLAIAGCLFQNLGFIFLKERLSGYGLSPEELRGALAGAKAAFLSTAPPEVKQLAVEAVVDTIRRIFAMAIASGALVLVAGLGFKWEKIDFQEVGM